MITSLYLSGSNILFQFWTVAVKNCGYSVMKLGILFRLLALRYLIIFTETTGFVGGMLVVGDCQPFFTIGTNTNNGGELVLTRNTNSGDRDDLQEKEN